jgi:P-type conjugative transfer protein TrbJ
MQALGFANQLASQQSNQLLQIRALLIAEQNVLATRSQVQANQEAQRTAASEQLREGDYVPSTPVSWPIR